MRCPYRKITTTKEQYNATIIVEGFVECYKEDCPYYIPSYEELNEKPKCAKIEIEKGE